MDNSQKRKEISVYADWKGLGGPVLMGVLSASVVRGKEVFSFDYDKDWLTRGINSYMDPDLQFFTGPQYLYDEKKNFGLFLDSSPDRWGRVLMKRRESLRASYEQRRERKLFESDFLLGVYDYNRIGALRFKLDREGPFLDDDNKSAVPPWESLRKLEYAALQVDASKDRAVVSAEYSMWLDLLMAPGSSLGGARPKAGVIDDHGSLWIAKFPKKDDQYDTGAWEMVVHQLADQSGIAVPHARLDRFSSPYHTFLIQRFDRDSTGARIHFASAMTLLGHTDGSDAADGASYLDIAEFIIRQGSRPDEDLKALWIRMVFSMLVSNTDDHLRNHGFLLKDSGWRLSPAYDMNPEPFGSRYGLSLNVTETGNALNLETARECASYYRLSKKEASEIIHSMKEAVAGWPAAAARCGISEQEQKAMSGAFALAQ